jgi:hypothetical protein
MLICLILSKYWSYNVGWESSNSAIPKDAFAWKNRNEGLIATR